jgi:hypothetical protein
MSTKLDLMTIDAVAVKAGAETDALIDIEWIGNPKFDPGQGEVPEHAGVHWAYGPDREGPFYEGPDYSTNPAHAGEARRKADGSYLDHLPSGTCIAYIPVGEHVQCGECDYTETNGDKALAEALAICRAILATLQAAEKAKGGDSRD